MHLVVGHLGGREERGEGGGAGRGREGREGDMEGEMEEEEEDEVQKTIRSDLKDPNFELLKQQKRHHVELPTTSCFSSLFLHFVADPCSSPSCSPATRCCC